MLARVAESLYWMSRYLERAEHTARLIDVHLNLMLDQSPTSSGPRWGRLQASLVPPPAIGGAVDGPIAQPRTPALDLSQSASFVAFLAAARENTRAIVACLAASRENARQVRELISSEMWEQINRLFLQVKRSSIDDTWNAQPHEFFRAVYEGSHLFQGITDSTMSHGEGWDFIQVGRFIERAGATAILLHVHHDTLRDSPDPSNGTDANHYLEWVGVLRCAAAFETYCKVYSADPKPHNIAEFLLLNAEFPHSVRYAVDMVQAALQKIAQTTATRKAGRVERLAGRLRASLGFAQIDEIMAGGLHPFLEDFQDQCAEIQSAIHQTYIGYTLESALAS